MHIKVDDIVEIIAGKDSGKDKDGNPPRGKVLKVFPETNKVIVEGFSKITKHIKPSKDNPKGGLLSKEAPFAASNVQLVCNSCKARSRTGVKHLEDGSKVRVCKKCGSEIGTISPAKK